MFVGLNLSFICCRQHILSQDWESLKNDGRAVVAYWTLCCSSWSPWPGCPGLREIWRGGRIILITLREAFHTLNLSCSEIVSQGIECQMRRGYPPASLAPWGRAGRSQGYASRCWAWLSQRPGWWESSPRWGSGYLPAPRTTPANTGRYFLS